MPSSRQAKRSDDKRSAFKRDTEKMVKEIDSLVSSDWGYSVTDDMVDLQSGGYRDFTQKQAREMSGVIGKVYMIAHAIHCNACGRKYATEVSKPTKPTSEHPAKTRANKKELL